MLRIICWPLFLMGFTFACFSWSSFALLPIAVMPDSQNEMGTSALDIGACVLSASGYLIWFGWGAIALGLRLTPGRNGIFWLMSLFNHLGWLVWFPCFRGTSLAEFSANLWPIYLWLIVNIMIALGAVMVLIPQLMNSQPAST